MVMLNLTPLPPYNHCLRQTAYGVVLLANRMATQATWVYCRTHLLKAIICQSKLHSRSFTTQPLPGALGMLQVYHTGFILAPGEGWHGNSLHAFGPVTSPTSCLPPSLAISSKLYLLALPKEFTENYLLSQLGWHLETYNEEVTNYNKLLTPNTCLTGRRTQPRGRSNRPTRACYGESLLHNSKIKIHVDVGQTHDVDCCDPICFVNLLNNLPRSLILERHALSPDY